MKTFVEEFMEASKDAEAPKSFFYWAALCAISAVIKRNVWIPRTIPGMPRTFPNIFVFLVAESGLRKGVAISFAKQLVGAVNNTRIISGRSSIQGIISALGTAYTLPDGHVISKAHGFISSSEFASSIVRDPDALTILTDLYDSCYYDKWQDTLRGGKVELIEPSITLLAGINPPHFEDFISPTAIMGGFVGRLFLVFENKKDKINPAIRKKDIVEFDSSSLVERLKEISQVQGEMKFDDDAIQLYEDWYIEFEMNRPPIPDKTGSINRVGDNVLKVATLLSLSRSADTRIVLADVQEAIRVCTTTLSNVNKATVSQGKTSYAPQTKLVLISLLNAKNYEMSRTTILSSNYGAIDAQDLDRVIETLVQSKAVKIERRGVEVYYKLTDYAIQQLEGGSK